MFATQVLPEDVSDDSREDNESEIIGFIIVDNKKYELKRGETKIGRDSSMCSIVIENFTISKVHAVIESEGVDDTFIYDVGSTNQTKLGKKILKPHCRYKIDSESKITLGNITAKFVIPPDNNSDCDSPTAKSGNFDPLKELGDIFDVPTQVNCVQPDTSSKVSAFEKLPENFQIFKIPHSVSTAEPSTLLKSHFEEETQCKSDCEQTKQRTVFYASSLENSGIFSLGTQCQLYENPAEQEDKCTVVDKNSKNNESDKIKLLLNDGQDDVLCCFMSLHSPDEKGGVIKEVNVKTELKGLTQVFDAQTQAQVETIEDRERKELSEILKNKDLIEDFTMTSEPSVTSTPVSNKFIHPSAVSKKNNAAPVEENLIETQEFNCVTSTPVNSKFIHPSTVSLKNNAPPVEEDFIQTQEFSCTPLNDKFIHPGIVSTKKNITPIEEDMIQTQQYIGLESRKDNSRIAREDLIQTQEFNCLESRKEAKDTTDNSSEDEETQPYLDDTLVTSQQNEDLVLTQTFDALERSLQNIGPNVVPETEEVTAGRDDFLETQIFPVEKETRREAPESPDRTVDTSFTHRNDEDDFIATQIFEGPIIGKNGDKKSDREDSDDDEDFIATQKVELPVRGTTNARVAGTRPASRESSPDLLTSDSFAKAYEDCINTQIFEAPSCQNTVSSAITEQISSHNRDNDCNVAQVPEPDNSGDETESDLEILLDETTKTDGQPCLKFIKSEQADSNPQTSQNEDSNSSYIFELEPENRAVEQRQPAELSDSDATDCEEAAITSPKIQIKEEPKEKMEFEDTQVLTLTLPDDFAEPTSAPNNEAESPKFRCESPLSLEMPNTQDIQTTVDRFLRNVTEKEDPKTEVGLTNGGITPSRVEPSKNVVDSPLKRPRDSNNVEVVPVKKSKTENRLLKNSEIQLTKLVQAHDIAQIQPGRTRNSLKSLAKENKNGPLGSNINERPTSRRRANAKKGSHPNGDITPYLTKRVERKLSYGGGRKATTSPCEPMEGSIGRVLRSSTRATTTTNPQNPSTRKSKRNSRTGEYFRGSDVNVVFTGFDCEFLGKIISDLGGKKTNDLSSGDVVVADKVRRTVKFLSAVGLGMPIASPEWLLSCKKENKFLNPWNFILKDEAAEETWNFELKASLEKSKKLKLLEGFSIYATKSTKPPVKDLLAIVEFCGGTPLFDYPDVWPKKTIIVSCLEDKKWWPLAKLRNVKVVHYEFILTGVLRQKVDFKTYKLR